MEERNDISIERPLNMKQDRDVILLFGMQGSGKSYLAKKIIETLAPKYERVVIFDLQDEYEYPVLVSNARELRDIIIEGKEKKIGVQITDFEEAERIFSVIFDSPNTLLVIDEAEVFIEKMTNARTSYFHKIVSFGRHDNIGLLAIGRRPVELNVYLRAARTTLITFRLNETQDIDRMERYGFNRKEVEQLSNHEYLLLGNSIFPETINKERKLKQ